MRETRTSGETRPKPAGEDAATSRNRNRDATVEIPFEFREGLLWVKVTLLQSAETLNFLLDTGAGASVINRSTADRLKLKPGRATTVRGVATTFTGYRLQGIAVRANGVSLPSDYLAVDLARLSGSCERPVDGLLGADFFRGRVIQLDLLAQKLRILKAPQVSFSAETLPLELRPCGMIIPITVNGHKGQWVRLDTGCASALQWVSARLRPGDCKTQVAIGLAEVSIPQAQTTVEIGHQKFTEVPTGLHENAIFAGEAGLLGNGLLARFSSITIDTKARRLILEVNEPLP